MLTQDLKLRAYLKVKRWQDNRHQPGLLGLHERLVLLMGQLQDVPVVSCEPERGLRIEA